MKPAAATELKALNRGMARYLRAEHHLAFPSGAAGERYTVVLDMVRRKGYVRERGSRRRLLVFRSCIPSRLRERGAELQERLRLQTVAEFERYCETVSPPRAKERAGRKPGC